MCSAAWQLRVSAGSVTLANHEYRFPRDRRIAAVSRPAMRPAVETDVPGLPEVPIERIAQNEDRCT